MIHAPQEHTLAAVRYLTNWLSTYPMKNAEKEKENNTIKQIIHNNKYDTAILNKVGRLKMNKHTRMKERNRYG